MDRHHVSGPINSTQRGGGGRFLLTLSKVLILDWKTGVLIGGTMGYPSNVFPTPGEFSPHPFLILFGRLDESTMNNTHEALEKLAVEAFPRVNTLVLFGSRGTFLFFLLSHADHNLFSLSTPITTIFIEGASRWVLSPFLVDFTVTVRARVAADYTLRVPSGVDRSTLGF